MSNFSDFINQLASDIATQINLPSPNQILAKRVIELHRTPGSNTLQTFSTNLKTFGKFKDDYIISLWQTLNERTDLSSNAVDLSINPSQGFTNDIKVDAKGTSGIPKMIIQDHDVLLPSTANVGGLAMPKNGGLRLGKESDPKHVFKAPSTPRLSELGLDRLAMLKRKEKREKDEREVKKNRLDTELSSSTPRPGLQDNAEFKGQSTILRL